MKNLYEKIIKELQKEWQVEKDDEETLVLFRKKIKLHLRRRVNGELVRINFYNPAAPVVNGFNQSSQVFKWDDKSRYPIKITLFKNFLSFFYRRGYIEQYEIWTDTEKKNKKQGAQPSGTPQETLSALGGKHEGDGFR